MKKSLFGRALEHALMIRDISRSRKNDAQTRKKAQELLTERMGRMKGLPQKIGQGLLLFSDEEEAPSFRDLTNNAEPLPFDIVARELDQAWQQPWQQVLEHLDAHGRAASLGQVHRAVLKDGRQAAIKIAYPGIHEAVLNDLKMLGWLTAPVRLKHQAFSFAEYKQVLLADLEEELNYEMEARNQQDYARACANNPLLIIPEVIPELSRENVLATVWEEGCCAEQVACWPEDDRFHICTIMVRNFLEMLFSHGLIHADPHPGNYAFRTSAAGPEIVMYDFGSVARISKEKRMMLLRLIWAVNHGMGDPLSLMVGLGFKEELLAPMADRLPALCRVLFEPFITLGQFDAKTWERRKKVDQILGDDRWNFRFSGPPELTFVVRGFQGLFYYLDKFSARVSWSNLIQPIINRYLPDLAALRIPATTKAAPGFSHMAHHLKIKVIRQGETRVALTFQLGALDNLEDLMGEEVAKRVREQNIDIEEVVARARANGLRPGKLFSLQLPEEQKTVRVWLA